MSKQIDLMRQTGAELPLTTTPSEVTSLRVWHCKFKSLAALPAYDHLEELVIASFLHDSLELVAALPRLRYLQIVGLPKVTSLQPLDRLVRLECLSLSTLPSWDSTNRRTTVASLTPLQGLKALRHLELFGVGPLNMSLAALHDCSWVETARFAQYSSEEVATFYAKTGAVNEFNPASSFAKPGANI